MLEYWKLWRFTLASLWNVTPFVSLFCVTLEAATKETSTLHSNHSDWKLRSRNNWSHLYLKKLKDVYYSVVIWIKKFLKKYALNFIKCASGQFLFFGRQICEHHLEIHIYQLYSLAYFSMKTQNPLEIWKYRKVWFSKLCLQIADYYRNLFLTKVYFRCYSNSNSPRNRMSRKVLRNFIYLQTDECWKIVDVLNGASENVKVCFRSN